MKKSILLTGAMMLLMASCSNEEFLPNEEVKNDNAEPTLTIIATQSDDASSRIDYDPSADGKTINLTWTVGDAIYVCEAEKPTKFMELTLEEGAGTNTGIFTTSEEIVWEEGAELVAYYKANEEMYKHYQGNYYLETYFYPVVYNSVTQVQTADGSMEHLKDVNYMKSETFSYEEGTISSLQFSQMGAIMQLNLSGLSGKNVKKLELLLDDASLSLVENECFTIWAGYFEEAYSNKYYMPSASMTFGEEGAGVVADETLTAYLMLGATDATEGKTLTLTATTTDGEYTATVTGGKLEAGKIYSISKAMEKVVLPMGNKTAEQAVKGDLAMADGTFISKDDIEELTDEQKANVRGVVFWTEKNDKVYTYSSLAYDEIMKTDFPTCTHGLIVALNNVATGCKWQDPNASVVAWQTNTFSDANKSDYKQIAAINGETDNLKYILGYQNTKLLKAYNKYCSETTGMSDYIVKPVAELATWEATPGNEAPANTTGWFIPSAKELHMLCNKDVLYNTFGTTTYKAINPLIEALGGTELGETELGGAEMGEKKNYWSSTERRDDTEFAYQIYFNDGSFSRNGKYGLAYVRAVCAF